MITKGHDILGLLHGKDAELAMRLYQELSKREKRLVEVLRFYADEYSIRIGVGGEFVEQGRTNGKYDVENVGTRAKTILRELGLEEDVC